MYNCIGLSQLTALMEDCSLAIDSKATKRRRKEKEMRITFL